MADLNGSENGSFANAHLPADQVKVAVALKAFPGEEKMPLFVTLENERELSSLMDELVRDWRLENKSLFQLQFDSKRMPSESSIYIYESNRHLINTGDVLALDYTAQKMTDVVFQSFQNGGIDEFLLNKLVSCCGDKSFADVYLSSSGLDALKKYLLMNQTDGQKKTFELALQSVVNLMEHEIISWGLIDPEIVTAAMKILQESAKSTITNSGVIRLCLVIIESAITSSVDGVALVEQLRLDVSFFFHNIKVQEQDIQSKCISLVNLLFSLVSEEKRKQIKLFIYSSATRVLIKEKIFTAPIQQELAYQLYTLQTNMFNLLYERLMTPISPKDEAATRTISDLWQKAFVEDSSQDGGTGATLVRKGEARDLSRLGFRNTRDPLCDFAEVPPGAMALDCINFFANNYTAQYKQVVLENGRERADDLDCPVAQASVELTRLLATHILSIVKQGSTVTASDNCNYYPMFFSKDHPFEELFSICIVRFTKTWKEMKASSSDFNKVLMVVREQISRALQDFDKLYTFDSLKNKLNQWTYAKIEEIRQRELEEKEEQKTQAKPILQLRSMLEPEIKEVIKQQRLNKMMSGDYFKPHRRATTRKIFFRLSLNAKVLQYGPSVDTSSIPEELHSINILDITEVKEEKRENRNPFLGISISVQGKDPLILMSTDPTIHQLWLDGLNALRGDPMTSEQATKDMKELLSMEIKLRLLDAEGLFIPDEAPEVPPLPPNFNFVTA